MSLTDEQKALRRTGVSASEIAALAGLSRWATPMEIYGSKRHALEKTATLPMDLGDIGEEPIAQLYARRTGRQLSRVGTLRHARRALALATPDRAAFTGTPPAPFLERVEQLVDAERLVEVKWTSWRMAREWGAPGSDEVPEDYHAQVTWQMGVAGVGICDLAVLFDRDRFDIFTVPFSSEMFEGLYEIAERFWFDHVEPGIPPPPDATERYAAILAQVHPSELNGAYVEASAEVAETVRRWGTYKAAAKLIGRAIQIERGAILAAIGDNLGLGTPLGALTWKKTRDGEIIDWRGAADEALLMISVLLEKFGPSLPAEERTELQQRARALVSRHKKKKPGHRRLTVKWDEAPELADSLELPRLDAGDTEENADEESAHP